MGEVIPSAMTYTDNAMTVMLSARHRRRGVDRLLLLSLIMSAFIGSGAGVFLGFFSGVMVAAGCQLVFYPLLRAQADAGTLLAFRNGKVMEDVRQTRLTPWEMIDGTTFHTMNTVLIPGLTCSGLWLVLALLAAPAGWKQVLAVTAAVVWFPVLVLLTWAQAYLSQMMAAWANDSGSTPIGGVLALILGPLLLSFPVGLSYLAHLDLYTAAGIFIVSVFWVASLSRLFAGIGLAQADQLEHTIKAVKRPFVTRNRAVRPWNDNPIVMRECARDSANIAGGWLGLFLNRFVLAICLGLIPLLVVEFLLLQGAPRPEPALWLFLAAVYYLVQPTRAAARISNAMTEEREKRTLESLAVTRISTEEYVDGWAQVGWWPRAEENLLAVPCFAMLGYLCQVPFSLVFPLCLLLPLNAVAAAYLGFAVGVYAPSRHESGGDVGVFATFLITLMVAAGFIYFGYSNLLMAVWLLAVPVATGLWARRFGLRSVT